MAREARAGEAEPRDETSAPGTGHGDTDHSAPDEFPTLWDGPPRTGRSPGRRGGERLPFPARVGPYHLVRRLGEGGMGEVWLAEQHEPVRREVALKVIKRGMDTRRVIARFQAERQALAMMDHPAIAKVLEAGETERGRPYFVMEYVRGVPITEYCDRHRLDLNQRLELFRQVCDGVQHAHQKALIHRDLKPSNILVTEQQGRPVPKIIDFGVAKATAQRLTDSTLHTELGQFIGTPEFMSPEQAEANGEDVDTRSDVYSLGAVLYTLLAGGLPFEGRELRRQGPDGIRRTLREVEPLRPSQRVGRMEERAEVAAQRRTDAATLGRRLSGDLDWIVMRALEKDRNRRYGSPQELSAELGRHLGDLPVEAGPPSALYKVGKFVRRHRAGVAVSALLVLLLVAFAVATSLQASRLARERDEKERALAEADAVTVFLTDMLGAVSPERAGHDVSVREVLDMATRKLDSSLEDQPAVDSRLRMAIGSAYRSLGLFPEAEQQLRISYLTRRRLLGPDHESTLRSLFRLGNVAYEQGRYEEAEVLFREVLEGRLRILEPDHPSLILTQGNLALTLYKIGRADEALPLLEEAVEGNRRVLGPDDPQSLLLMNNLAALHHMAGRLEAAEPLYREVLRVSERAVGPRHAQSLVARHNLGELYVDQGRTELAEPLLLEVVEQKRRVFGEDHPSTLYSLSILAGLYGDLERHDAAAPLLEEVLAQRQGRVGPDHPRTLEAKLALAGMERRRGRGEAAQRLLREVLEAARRQGGGEGMGALEAGALHGLACLRAVGGQEDEALALLREALAAGLDGTTTPDPFADPDLRPLRDTPELKAIAAAWDGKTTDPAG